MLALVQPASSMASARMGSRSKGFPPLPTHQPSSPGYRPKPFSAMAPGLFQAPFWGPHDPSTRCSTWNTGLAVASNLWFWSACSGNALCPGARALCWTEQLEEPCCAPVELGHRPINKRGPDAVEHGPEPSESPAFRLELEIGASGKRQKIPKGNDARARVSFNRLRSHGQRVFSKERAT